MGATNVRERLRRACDAIDEASGTPATAEFERWLAGIRTQLRYFVDGDTTDPEARVYPSPGALETIQDRLDEVIDRTDDETVAEHLDDARRQIQQVRQMLDGRLASRTEPPAGE